MKELWTGLAELLTPPSELGDTKCFTNAFALGKSPEDFVSQITTQLEAEGITVLDIESIRRVPDDEVFPEETQPFVDWARQHPDDFTTANRHYYPSKQA
jgi:hypothetical protein